LPASSAIYSIPTGLVRLLHYFSWQPQVEADWSRGIVRDLPRSSIPAGGLYICVDFLVDRPGILRKRSPFSYLNGFSTGANTGGVNFVSAPAFPAGVKVVARGADGNLYDVTSGVSVGAFPIQTLDQPKLYVDKLIVTSSNGTTAPQKIINTAGTVSFAALGGSPPPARLSAVHISRVILGNSAANPNRIWFSPIPNVESTWDTANAYIDTNHSLSALASIQGVLLAFSGEATERLIGNVPPGPTGENMSLQPLGQIGCADARSIAAWGSTIIFASQEGVYVTNGAGFDSLTEKPDGSGISSLWRQYYAIVQANGGFISGGVMNRNYYILSMGYGTTNLATFMCYLPRKAWVQLSGNQSCTMYAPNLSGVDELYGASMSGHPGNKILSLSQMITGTGGLQDADGLAIQPAAWFRMSGTGVGQKVYGDGHLTYAMVNSGQNPTLNVFYQTGVKGETAFKAVPESPLPPTATGIVAGGQTIRKRFSISTDAQAVHVAVNQTGMSATTEIYLLEVDQREYDLQSETTP
jgi:hypothetical protein